MLASTSQTLSLRGLPGRARPTSFFAVHVQPRMPSSRTLLRAEARTHCAGGGGRDLLRELRRPTRASARQPQDGPPVPPGGPRRARGAGCHARCGQLAPNEFICYTHTCARAREPTSAPHTASTGTASAFECPGGFWSGEATPLSRSAHGAIKRGPPIEHWFGAEALFANARLTPLLPTVRIHR